MVIFFFKIIIHDRQLVYYCGMCLLGSCLSTFLMNKCFDRITMESFLPLQLMIKTCSIVISFLCMVGLLDHEKGMNCNV